MKRVMKMTLLLAISACGDDGGAATDAPAVPDAAPADAAKTDATSFGDPLAGVGTVELVEDGLLFTEGPQWRDTEGDLLFSDVQGNTTYRYVPGGDVTVFRMPSANANGLAIDPMGKVLSAEHGSRSVTRAATPIATMLGTKRLNSPNDLVAAADGTIYFTDPPFGINPATQQELDFNGVFRIAPNGTLTAEYMGATSTRPNGIGLSPDGATVYVADTADGNLYRFPVGSDGALGTRSLVSATAGNPDGLAIDTDGNIFVAVSTGIEVFSPSGQRWGLISVSPQPANCAFGDADHKTLYITARPAVYRVHLAHAGLPRN